jgi:hypothetical protein
VVAVGDQDVRDAFLLESIEHLIARRDHGDGSWKPTINPTVIMVATSRKHSAIFPRLLRLAQPR